MRLVQHHKCIREGPPPHKGQWRNFDDLFLDHFGHLLARQKIIQRVIKRLHVGVDLILHVAGQIAELFPRFDGRTAKDDLVDVARDEHVHPHGNGKIGLASSRRTDAEGQFVVVKRLDVGLLRLCPGFDQFAPSLDFYPAGIRLTLEHFDLVAAFGNSTVRDAHPKFSVDVTGFQRLARL